MSIYSPNQKVSNSCPDQLLDSLVRVHLTHGIVFRGTQMDYARLLRTLELEFPDLYIVYKASSVDKLWLKHGNNPEELQP